MNQMYYQRSLEALVTLARIGQPRDISGLLEAPDRLKNWCFEAGGLFADLSRAAASENDLEALLNLAEAAEINLSRQAMFDGAEVNFTEHRGAWHTLLRAKTPPSGNTHAKVAFDEIQANLVKMRALADLIRRQEKITDVVHVGIGGSYLGPELVVQALAKTAKENASAKSLTKGPNIHFVANVDAYAWDRLEPLLSPHSTLVIVASKSWTTRETDLNARAIREWFEKAGLGAKGIAEHWVGVTSKPELAMRSGLTETQIFPFEAWVGGRFSLWSAIGLPIMLAHGTEAFDALLAGAESMDAHFQAAPLRENLPVRLALLSLWHQLHLNSQTEAVIPYSQRLARLPAFLQQLQMESNGKRVDALGQPLKVPSSPVVWGEPGTDSQHSFFQALHHSPQIQPIDFILVAKHDSGERALALQANAISQIEALSLGKASNDGHRHYPGNRPCHVMVLPDLSPRVLGALLALYEHKTAALGWILNINSFDQFGVELGKEIAQSFEGLLGNPTAEIPGTLNPATRSLLGRLQRAN